MSFFKKWALRALLWSIFIMALITLIVKPTTYRSNEEMEADDANDSNPSFVYTSLDRIRRALGIPLIEGVNLHGWSDD